MKKNNNRRKFLKNSSLSLLSMAAFPTILKSTSSSHKELNMNFNNACQQSTEDAYGQGPFYTPNSPNIQNNQLASSSEFGTKVIISGQVYNLECSEVIPNVEIDIWHANHAGEYDNQGYNLRGKVISNSQGFYIFETIKPGLYLNGSTYRPSHIHFKITPPGHDTLITQLYFQGDPYITTDGAASITSGSFDATHRIIPLITNSNGELEGTWDIIIDANGLPVATKNIHLDKGIIYNANPNPFTHHIEINYGVFRKARVSIFVHNIYGQIVANLDDRILEPDIYSVSWHPSIEFPKGYYFVSIIMNDLQIDYLKLYKK